MNEGCIVQVDDYHGLYHTPVNLFIAQFFGTPPMNFFNGTIHNGKWQGENFSGYAIRQDLPNDTPVTMGIRPQYLTLQDDGVAGVVESVVPYLSERFNLVEVSSGTEGWTLALPLEASTPVGQTIHCGLSHEHIHFFDTKTGLRIG
jgi:ABC-type sugar transport system ATPase subunit